MNLIIIFSICKHLAGFVAISMSFPQSNEFGSGADGSLLRYDNNPNQRQSTTVAPLSSSSIVETKAYVICKMICPSVMHYNPVCGSDQVTYYNIFRLDCANECGQDLDSNWNGKHKIHSMKDLIDNKLTFFCLFLQQSQLLENATVYLEHQHVNYLKTLNEYKSNSNINSFFFKLKFWKYFKKLK